MSDELQFNFSTADTYNPGQNSWDTDTKMTHVSFSPSPRVQGCSNRGVHNQYCSLFSALTFTRIHNQFPMYEPVL